MSRKFEAIISILDRASLPLMAIEEKMRNLGTRAKKTEVEIKEIGATSLLKSRIGQDIHAIGARLHGIGHSIHEHLGGPMEKVGGTIEKIVEAVPVLGALGGLGSLAGFVEGVRNTAELSERLTNLSTISGLTVPALQELQFAVKDTGVSTDQMATGLGRLNANIGLAAMGHNKALLTLFSSLHISLRNANGSIRNASSILPQLMDDLSKTASSSEQAAIATKLFGRTGRELLPFLDQGSAKIQELHKRFKAYGNTLSENDQKGLEKFTHSWNDLELAVGGVIQKFSVALAPALAPVLDDFAQWIALEGRLIAPKFKADLKWFDEKIKKFDWKTFEKNGGTAFKDIETAASALWAVLKPIIDAIQTLQAVHKFETKALQPVHNMIYGAPITGLDTLPTSLTPKALRGPSSQITQGGLLPAASPYQALPSQPAGPAARSPRVPFLPGLLTPPMPRSPAKPLPVITPRHAMRASPYATTRPPAPAPQAPAQATVKLRHEHTHVFHNIPGGGKVSTITKTKADMPNPSVGENGTLGFQQW